MSAGMVQMNLVELLLHKQLKITTAESCTGGLIAKQITDVAGSSACFEMGFVTYCDRAKEELLGVKPETLSEHTAVSSQVAQQMAEGARTKSGADIAVSVTGNAGPSGEPLGRVYIGISGKYGTEVHTCDFEGGREQVRVRAAKAAQALAAEYIIDYFR